MQEPQSQIKEEASEGGGFLSNLFGNFLRPPADVPKKCESQVYNHKELSEKLRGYGTDKMLSDILSDH